MSDKAAEYSAFMAGYRAAVMHKNRSHDLAERHFEKWWRDEHGGDPAPSKPARKRHYDTYDKQRDIEAEGQRAANFYDQQEKGIPGVYPGVVRDFKK